MRIESKLANGKSYAEVVKEKEGLDEILKRILIKLDKQEQTNKVILERLTKLEADRKKTYNKKAKRQ